jgi:hypothetical protein
MKKVFPLVSERHKPARLAEQIKGEFKKYLKRERNKSLPDDHDYWGFNCRSGENPGAAEACHEKEIGKSLDQALAAGWSTFYLEILAEPRKRASK